MRGGLLPPKWCSGQAEGAIAGHKSIWRAGVLALRVHGLQERFDEGEACYPPGGVTAKQKPAP